MFDIHCWRYSQFGNCLKCRMLWFYCGGLGKDDEEFKRVLLSLKEV